MVKCLEVVDCLTRTYCAVCVLQSVTVRPTGQELLHFIWRTQAEVSSGFGSRYKRVQSATAVDMTAVATYCNMI